MHLVHQMNYLDTIDDEQMFFCNWYSTFHESVYHKRLDINLPQGNNAFQKPNVGDAWNVDVTARRRDGRVGRPSE